MRVNATKLAETYNVDRNTVINWKNERPGCPSVKEGRERMFDLAEVAKWREDRAARKAIEAHAKLNPASREDIRNRRELAETRIAEIELATLEGTLISTEVHKEVVGEVCDRLRAVLINIPSNFGLHLEKAGVPAAKAQSILEEMTDSLTLTTRTVADQLDEADDSDE